MSSTSTFLEFFREMARELISRRFQGVSSSPLPSRRSGVSSLKDPSGAGRSVGRKIRNALLRNAGLKKNSTDASTGKYLTFGREIREEVEVESFLTSVSALLKLMQNEAQLLKAIIPERQGLSNIPSILSMSAFISESRPHARYRS